VKKFFAKTARVRRSDFWAGRGRVGDALAWASGWDRLGLRWDRFRLQVGDRLRLYGRAWVSVPGLRPALDGLV